jgi:hypothetical protein
MSMVDDLVTTSWFIFGAVTASDTVVRMFGF